MKTTYHCREMKNGNYFYWANKSYTFPWKNKTVDVVYIHMNGFFVDDYIDLLRSNTNKYWFLGYDPFQQKIKVGCNDGKILTLFKLTFGGSM